MSMDRVIWLLAVIGLVAGVRLALGRWQSVQRRNSRDRAAAVWWTVPPA